MTDFCPKCGRDKVSLAWKPSIRWIRDGVPTGQPSGEWLFIKCNECVYGWQRRPNDYKESQCSEEGRGE